MAWFKVDDSFHSHPKVKSIPRAHRSAAIGLWTMAGSWCADNLQDGLVPAYMIEEFGATDDDAERLVAAGLWAKHTKGFRFHDWRIYQPTRQAVEADREATRQRVQRHRERKRNGVTGDGVTPDVTVPPTRPDPTRPDPETSPGPGPSRSLPINPAAAAAVAKIRKSIERARASGSNAWRLIDAVDKELAPMIACGDEEGMTGLIAWYAEQALARAIDRRDWQNIRSMVAKYQAIALYAIDETSNAEVNGPVWPYARKVAERLYREAQ